MLYTYAPRSSAFAERIRGAKKERSGTACFSCTPILPNGQYCSNQSDKPIDCDLTKSTRFGEHKSVARADSICLLSRAKGVDPLK